MKTSRSHKSVAACTPLIAALVVCTLSAAGYHLLKKTGVVGTNPGSFHVLVSAHE